MRHLFSQKMGQTVTRDTRYAPSHSIHIFKSNSHHCYIIHTGFAHASGAGELLDLTGHAAGILALILFLLAYGLVIFEEVIHMRKSKPVMLAAGLIWACIAFAYMGTDKIEALNAAAKHNILEYGELFLFLMVAITYVNTLEERRSLTYCGPNLSAWD